MVSVLIGLTPLNELIAKEICEDNKDSHASYERHGGMIRITGEKKLVLNRGRIERAIGRELDEVEWMSVTWNHYGSIEKLESNEIIFVDSEESEAWDKLFERFKRKSDKS
jgi:hypothetical protein